MKRWELVLMRTQMLERNKRNNICSMKVVKNSQVSEQEANMASNRSPGRHCSKFPIQLYL